MYHNFKKSLDERLKSLKAQGLYKMERVITTNQSTTINTNTNANVLNFCANNYLGLCNHPDLIQAAKKTMDHYGYGLSSVRFICGTQSIHKQLEHRLSQFLKTEDTILYAAAFDANAGVFETLLDKDDAIISDQLNHASIIDGIRLCKANRFRYLHNDMADLETQLQSSQKCKHRIIVTDGVFSMDGTIAQLDKICALAEKYDALVMSDECHATGFIGETGRGVHEYHKVMDKIDIITGTLGKALGGASGGFVSARKEIIDMLRQKSRPYLFSNSVAPAIIGASIKVLDLIENDLTLKQNLEKNTAYFRKEITKAGFDIVEGSHPIIPVMLYDAVLSQKMAEGLLKEGVYVIGFYFPVVPKGKARIRLQISAAHTKEQLDHTIKAFVKVGKQLKVIE